MIKSSTKSRKVPMTQRLMKSPADYWQTLVERSPALDLILDNYHFEVEDKIENLIKKS